MANQKKLKLDIDTMLDNYTNSPSEETIYKMAVDLAKIKAILSNANSFQEYKRTTVSKEADSYNFQQEKFVEKEIKTDQRINKAIEQDQVVNKSNLLTTTKLVAAQTVPIVKQIGGEAVDLYLLKSRNVSDEIFYKQINEVTSRGIGLGVSFAISPVLGTLDLVSQAVGEVFNALNEQEELRQDNEQTTFERRALGNIRLNGGR